MTVRTLIAALGLLTVASACVARPCDETTCAGCCSSSGACVDPPRASACGLGGQTCRTCAADALCVDGACKPSGLSGADGGGEGSAWKIAFLDAHNRVRVQATPTPNPPLPPLQWNDAARAVAQAWADRCQWSHNPSPRYGENIYATTEEVIPSVVVSDWASEVADYTYATNSCANTCGHYTQLVWRATASVGCARRRCTTNSPFQVATTWYFWVCDYDPPGNVIGQSPY